MTTLCNISAYQEISQTKYMHCQASLERNICSSGHGHTAPCAQSRAAGQRAGFSQGCKGFCPAAAKHNIHMNLAHTAMSVQPQTQGSPSCWYHLCSLAQHLLGQGEWGPSTRHKKPLLCLVCKSTLHWNLLKVVT